MPEYLIEVHRTATLAIEAPDAMQARAKAADVAWTWWTFDGQDSVATQVVSSDA